MDDVGSLAWRFGKRFIVSSADAEHEAGDKEVHALSAQKPPKILHPPAAE
jgi:hypothetical protein